MYLAMGEDDYIAIAGVPGGETAGKQA